MVPNAELLRPLLGAPKFVLFSKSKNTLRNSRRRLSLPSRKDLPGGCAAAFQARAVIDFAPPAHTRELSIAEMGNLRGRG